MKDFWNKRYANKEYVYGIEPNVFFKEAISQIENKGKVLFPAEGEGRNSVYASTLGWESFAFDISIEGRKKALELADEYGVNIDYQICTFEEYNPKDKFDLIVLSYSHVEASKRLEYYQKCVSWLKNGGILILEGFSKNQFGLSSGGPKNEEMLYSIEELKNEFNGLSFELLKEERIILNEGEFHQGVAEVIRLIGKKL